MYINPTNPHSSNYGSSGLPHGLTQDAVGEIRDIQSQLIIIQLVMSFKTLKFKLNKCNLPSKRLSLSFQPLLKAQDEILFLT
jgi:hypothetical protein